MTASSDYTQDDVRAWFDSTYEEQGFKYLRPIDAYPIFVQLLGARPGESLLDVACGPGLLLKAATLRGLEATGADISARAVEIANQYVPEAQAHESNAESLPFEDGTFDNVTCIGAIERFFDRPKALAEMRRVARDDARFCFMVRNASTLVWTLWRKLLGKQNKAGHQDALDLEQWKELFAQNGFGVREVHMDQWWRQRLRKVFRGFRKRDLRRDEPVARPWIPMRYVNEFIFILEKLPDTAS